MSYRSAVEPPGAVPPLARLLEALGPIGVKIGQYLAVRPDIIPEDQVVGLLMLVDHDMPRPWVEISSIISSDLGQPVEVMFEWINPTPAVSGALTQTHVGRTRDGAPVAIKVLRPGASDAVTKPPLDKLLRGVGDHCGLDEAARARLGDDIRLWLLDQGDLEREYRNAVRLREVEVRDQWFRIPTPYRDYSSPRIFTASQLDGVRLTDVLPLARGNVQRIRALGIDPHDLADNVVESVLQQVFALDLFHAGPHPSSLVALPDDQIGFVDLAFVDRIDASVRDRLLAFVSAVQTGDTERVVRAATAVIATSDYRALDAFRTDFAERARRFRRDAEVAGDTGAVLVSLMRALVEVAQRHGIPMGSETLAYHRAVLTADTIARQLSPGAGLRRVADRFFLRLQVQTVVGEFSFSNAQALALDVVDLLTTAPGQLGRLLSDLADDRFVFRVATSESDEDRRAGNVRARLVSLAIVFVGVAILVTGPDLIDAAAGVRAIAYGVLAAISTLFAVLWIRLR